MLARFFVDRPIFAWVVSIVIVLCGVAAGTTLPIAQYPEITPPSVVVTCAYPGASAQVVADTVAAPIEQQVNGVDNMLYMSSVSGNDGSYTLTVTFEIGTDSDTAQVLVQNRVSLANPQLPQEVQRQGITVKKRSPDILLVVSLFCPDDTPPESKRDQLYLSNYATIQIRDELSRLKGVGDVVIIGQQDYSMRAWLDPDKLQASGLTASDVVKAVQEQNVQVAAGQIGQEPAPLGQAYQLTVTTLGRLTDPDQFADIVLKTGSPADPNANPNNASAAGTSATTTDVSGGTAAAGARATGPTATVRARPLVRLRDVVRDDRPMEVVGEDGKPASKMYRGVELTAKSQDVRATLNTKPSAGLAIFQLPGSNALQTADAIKAKMEELKKKFPTGVDYVTRYDTTPFVRQSVAEVFNTLRDAVILVALVVLLFLQDWKTMILPMIDVPVSLTGTFVVMYAAGFSLNNLTLFGLVLAIGIVVDDAIVVLENVERWVAKGLDARSATLKAMGEITGPILAITLVLAAVFVPAAFVTGITGQFYRQFALTIATAMAISAVNALTLAPARAALIFKSREKQEGHGGEGHKPDGKPDDQSHPPTEALPWWGVSAMLGYATYLLAVHFLGERLGLAARPLWAQIAIGLGFAVPGLVAGWFVTRPLNWVLAKFFGLFNRAFAWATEVYGRTVAVLLRVALLVLVVYVGLIGLTYVAFTRTPTGFIPLQDKGYLLVSVQLPDAASVQRTSEVMRQVEEIAHKIPGVAGTVAYSGQSVLLGANAPNFGTMFITFDDFEARKHDPKQYGLAILGQFNATARKEVMDAQVIGLPAPAVNGLGSAGGYKLLVQDRGDLGPDDLGAATNALIKKIGEDGGGQAFTQYKAAIPQLYADVDRIKCKQLGVALSDVFQTLQVYLGGLYTNDFNKFGRTWQVNIQADAAFRTTPEAVRNLRVRNDKGEMVPLGAVAEIRDSTGPIIVQRYNLYPSAAVNGALPPGMSSGDGIKHVEQAAAETLTGQMRLEWTELTYLQIREGSSAIFAFVGGVLLVYFILAAMYESWTLPLAVLLVVPMCILSSLAGVLLTHQDLNIFTQVGFLVLVGMAAKNAILIVQFARDRRLDGATATEATLDAAKTRLRPIIMTSLAFILGMVPLVLASGAGAEMRFTLGIAVFAGMIGVTVFGIFLTPVFYHTIEKWTAGEAPVAEKKPGGAEPTGEQSPEPRGRPAAGDNPPAAPSELLPRS